MPTETIETVPRTQAATRTRIAKARERRAVTAIADWRAAGYVVVVTTPDGKSL